MKRLTKIVATIGPACDSEEMIAKMINSGVNIFRFNFKHNDVEWHDQMIERVNKVAKKVGVRIGTLIDLQGPEIRINMPVPELALTEGEVLSFGEEVFSDTKLKGLSITHPDIIEHLMDGQKVVADDGAFDFQVVKRGKKTMLMSLTTGTLKTRKTLNIPGADFPFPVLIKRDFDGLKLAERREVDFVALSFVRTGSDLKVLRKEMKKYNLKSQVVSKIETQKALDHLEEIVDLSDAIMVARGDLGVELPIEQVPFHQKQIIRMCIEKTKPVITATQMLESMITNPYPTRAEVSDVANASYDMTDTVMLSGESANGKYPTRAVDMMHKVLTYNETKFVTDSRQLFKYQVNDKVDLICDAAYDLYKVTEDRKLPIAGFVVFTHTGRTARTLSMYRPNLPILAMCSDKKVADSLTICYAVTALVSEKNGSDNSEVKPNQVEAGLKQLLKADLIKTGENYIVIHGDHWAVEGGTSTIKLITV